MAELQYSPVSGLSSRPALKPVLTETMCFPGCLAVGTGGQGREDEYGEAVVVVAVTRALGITV
jgi:hypothetical protein